jgi:signal transduction histidine kinase
MSTVTAEDFAGIVSLRLAAERLTLARQWLDRLNALLSVGPNEIFPSEQLLDHIPTLIGDIAAYLRAPEHEEIAANATVIEKARELGVLRHQQQASVHQLLREYEILSEILEQFVVHETERMGLRPSPAACFEVVRRLTQSARTLMRTTIDTFVSRYTATIQEHNDRIDAFNRLASHELRSPIGTLVFAAAMLDTDVVRTDPARLDKVAATIRSNAQRLSWLVQNLQRVTQLTEHVDVPTEQRLELVTIALEVKRQLQEMADAKGVAIRVDPRLPVFVGDPARMELVFLNLVSNAIKYSDPLKAASFVELLCVLDGASDGKMVLCVRDNGIGIPESDQESIFERFFRAHAHRDADLGVTGSGLGLAIVADCVTAMGGSIRCESTLGEGSAFFVELRRGAAAPLSERS